jgi:hypothetical protein
VIHHKPVCFDCDSPIESGSDVVYAPPMCDHADCGSACFHPLCLMRWRERRDVARERAQKIAEGFAAHMNGECSCQPPTQE